MARYRLHQKSYLQSAEDMVEMIHDEGSIIDVAADVPPGPHWEALDDEARTAAAHFRANPPKMRSMDQMDIVRFAQAPDTAIAEVAKTVPIEPVAQKRAPGRPRKAVQTGVNA